MMLQLKGVFVRHLHLPSLASNALPLKDDFVLRDLTFNLQQGEQVAIIGPSGAGKTSLLLTLACAMKPAQGSFQLFGVQPWLLSHRARHTMRKQLFIAPQTPPLPPRQRVITTVLAGRLPEWSLWQALRSLIKPIAAREAFNALKLVQLEDKLYTRVDRLSGGERQRCGLARLFLSKAKLLLVDEPLSALDPTLAVQVLQNLQQQASVRNASLICSLHQVEFARQYFNRIIGLRQGKIIFDVTQNELTDELLIQLYGELPSPNLLDQTHADFPEAMSAPSNCTALNSRCL